MLSLGYLSAICILSSFIFKAMHMPGANVLMIAGTVLFIAGFAPLLFFIRNKASENTITKLGNIIAFLAMIVVSAGVMLKFLHLNYSGPVILTGIVLTSIFTLMMVILAIGQKDDRWSINYHSTAIMLMITVSLIAFIWISRTPVQILTDFDQIILTQNNEIKFYDTKTNGIFDNLDKSPNNNAAASFYQKSVEVKTKADSLVNFLRSVGEELMYKADSKSIPYDSILLLKSRANRAVCVELMIEQKKDSIYSASFAAFKTFIEPNTNSKGKEILDQFFTIKDTVYTTPDQTFNWSEFKFRHSLIAVLAGLNSDILHIRMLEAETINYLQTMQAKAMLRND